MVVLKYFSPLFGAMIIHLLVGSVLSGSHSILDSDSSGFRRLHAATRRHNMIPRHPQIELSYTAQLDYIDRKCFEVNSFDTSLPTH
jgi:hypothetical protein